MTFLKSLLCKIYKKKFNKLKYLYLRRLIRGYRYLRASTDRNYVSLIKEKLTIQQLNCNPKYFRKFMFGGAISSAEIPVRQYILNRYGGLNMNKAILHALGKKNSEVLYPLPQEWRIIFKLYGFKVSFYPLILWRISILNGFLRGVFRITMKIIMFIWGSIGRDTKNSTFRYVYFDNLDSGNLPKIDNGRVPSDLISWYLRQGLCPLNIDAISHNVSGVQDYRYNSKIIHFQNGPLPNLVGWVLIIRFVFWSFGACAIALFDAIFGRGWYALLLDELASTAHIRLMPKALLAHDYYFNNSQWIYRPLWTYEAEARGANIVFYFYSVNCQGYKIFGQKMVNYIGYKTMNWPKYLVWNHYQEDFLKRAISQHIHTLIVGPILFQDSLARMPKINRRAVSVFDITPLKDSIYVQYCEDVDYIVPQVVNIFLRDCHEIIKSLNGSMLIKQKRESANRAHSSYRNTLIEISKSSSAEVLDPAISSSSLMQVSVAVISFPFTSTAVIAKEMGIPSVYYDPIGVLCENERHGVRIISRKDDLYNWLQRCLG